MFRMKKLSKSESLARFWIPEGVQRYVERRSFFVTKMAFKKKKNPDKSGFFHVRYVNLKFNYIHFNLVQAIFVIWTFFTCPKLFKVESEC